MRVLDLDLDFFVTPIANWKSDKDRLDPTEYVVDSIENVRVFLEDQCGLSCDAKTPGATFEEHDEIFDHISSLRDAGIIASPIELHHVDAHSDVGGGMTRCWVYVEQELVHLPVEQRVRPKRGGSYLNPGNFIVFLAACRWLREIHFVVPEEWRDDTHPMYLKDFCIGSRALQLKRYQASDIKAAGLTANLGSIPHTLEPEVPFTYVRRRKYRAPGKFDRMFLTRSPGFTPAGADKVFDFVREYIALTEVSHFRSLPKPS